MRFGCFHFQNMKKLITAFWIFIGALACQPALAQAPAQTQSADSLRPAFLLTGALHRDRQDLSGQWTY